MKLLIHIDGGSRGNPGPAACGVVIHDPDKQVLLVEAGYFLGRLTNNVAEYHGLLKALELAGDLHADALDIRSDSELMVRQLQGQYKVKAPQLKPLFDQAVKLLERFKKWSIRHVYREANLRADELANRAMDCKSDLVFTYPYGFPPVADQPMTKQPTIKQSQPQPKLQPLAKLPFETLAQGKPRKVLVEFITDPQGPGSACPVVAAMEHHFAFTEVTPQGMCIDAAASVLEALTSNRPLPKQLICKRCKAKIGLTSI